MVVDLEVWQGDGERRESEMVVALFFLLKVNEQVQSGLTHASKASRSCTEDVKEHCDILLGRLWEAAGLGLSRWSQADEGESNWEGPGCTTKSPKKERQKGCQETTCGHLLWPPGEQATQRRKLDSEVGLDHK